MGLLGSLPKQVSKLLSDNSPVILTAIGVVGTLSTAYLTGKASLRAADLIFEENMNLNVNRSLKDSVETLDARDKVKLTWKLYIPAAASAGLTVAAIIFANRIGSRRAAAVAAAYAISERAFEEYRSKIVEKLGPKKEQLARDEIAQEQINRNPVSKNIVIFAEDKSVLCYESFTGRYFLSDHETLRAAMNDVNEQILHDGYASLGEFYIRVGLPQTSYSEEVGWNTDNLLELNFSTCISEDNKPCFSVIYRVHPIRHYYRQ